MTTPFLNRLTFIAGLILFFSGMSYAQNTPNTFTDRTNLLLTDNFSGVCIGIADMNADGKDDILRYNYGRILNIEFQKSPNLAFDHGNGGAIANASQWSTAIADVDRNGYNDVIVGGDLDNIKLLRNANGLDYELSNIPNSNIFVQGTNFVDLNNDGWLDLFACNDIGDSREYMNNGSGEFAFSPDIINTKTTPSSDNSGNYSSIWTDYDNDGDLDLYISKCKQGVADPTDPRRVNMFFENDGANNFIEKAGEIGLKIGAQTWLTEFADIDNDGDMDAFIINHFDDCQLLLNNGSGKFIDITASSGFLPTLSEETGVFGIQAIFRDFDNDGYVDLLFSGSHHYLFYNNGDRTFKRTNPLGTEQIESFALGDLNHDGFIDIYAGYAEFFTQPSDVKDALFMNDGNDNNFIALQLEGIESNTNAVGARIEIYGSFGQQLREVRAGEGYGIMNSFTQHFGIGRHNTVTRMVIKWPSGIIQSVSNPQINQFHQILEKLPCAGTICNDNDPCTTNDRNDDYCNCIGTFLDNDDDGVCDSEDLCPGYDDSLDSDNDGIPNGCDLCGNIDDDLIGQLCNDNNPCTVGERYDSNCNCSGGTILDNDNDGICNLEDRCPGYDDNLDSDNDGTPNGCDSCPNLNDSVIGQPCNDGNPCTAGEIYNTNCGCSGGQYVDGDNDGYCIGEDSNDNDPCVPDSSSANCGNTGNSSCESIDSTGFEMGDMGIWLDGGSNARILQDSNFAASGNHSFYIQGNSGASSSLYTSPLALGSYTSAALTFTAYPYSMETGDRFHVEVSTNGSTYTIYKTYSTNIDFTNQEYFTTTLELLGLNLSDNTRIRFRTQTNESGDYIMLDDLLLEGCNNNDLACSVGAACNDGDPCTSGETYDSLCDCTGGTSLDSDNDGICNSQDSCPNLNNSLIGQTCNDDNPCTSGETYDADCGCSGGTSTDNDADGYCAVEDPNDNDPCVPDANNGNCNTDLDCVTLNSTSFENNDLGIWRDGGSSASLIAGTSFANSGNYSFYVQGDNGAFSSLFTELLDLENAVSVILDFNVLPYSVETGDKLYIEIATNGDYSTFKTYNTGAEFVNNTRKFIHLRIGNLNFTNTTSIRFRSEGNSSSDYFIIDDLKIEICSAENNCSIGESCDDGDSCTIGEKYDANCDCLGGTISDEDSDGVCDNEDNCPGFNNNLIGTPCTDGNICTTGETYDDNCGCSGGTYTDADNDGFCVGNDADDNDPCVPNTTTSNCDSGNVLDCTEINFTDFEGADTGVWNDGGSSARLFAGTSFANSGAYSFYIQGDSGPSSSIFSDRMDLSGYEAVKVKFFFYAYSVEAGDKFYMELDNGNGNYLILKTYLFNEAFVDRDRVDIEETFDNINFSTSASIRFRAATTDLADYIILDDISIEGCQNGNGPACQIGDACSDGDPCTSGETYNSHCDCAGGTVIDNDNDGFCTANDIDDNDPCVPNANSPGCNSMSELNCEQISSVGFESNQLGIWNDGGGSARILNSASFANTGNYTFYIQGNNAGQSSLYTDPLNLIGVESVRLSFNYLAYALEAGDRFFVEISNGGNYFAYKTYIFGVDFEDNDRKDASLLITGVNFTNATSLRFRMGGNNVSDYIMLDDIKIEVCTEENSVLSRARAGHYKEASRGEVEFKLYPNPSSEVLYLDLISGTELLDQTMLQVYNLQGRVVLKQILLQPNEIIDLSSLAANQVYLFRITDENQLNKSYKVFKN